MSKYIKLEDAINLFGRSGEYHADAIVDMLFFLPTIEVSEEKYDEWCHDCKEYDKEKHCCPRWNKVIRQTVAEIREQSSKVGEWVIDEYGIPHCSECNCINNTVYRNYCPNCGADMKKTKNN